MRVTKSKSEYGTALQRHLDKKHEKKWRTQPKSSPWRKVFYIGLAIFLLMIVGVVMWLKSEGVSLGMLLFLLPAMIATYVAKR